MKLLISIVNHDDTYALTDALIQEGYDATIISTTGGFLREGNATILTGVQDEAVARVLEIIRAKCRTRTRYVNPLPPAVECEETILLEPIEVQVGGAIVFVLSVERFEHF
ncbi:MAG: cyclic-di-AMP receptor [Anaerolineae bacterium]|nr:cyclic-di-AMP receptor [Anaerolineae bacterium]